MRTHCYTKIFFFENFEKMLCRFDEARDTDDIFLDFHMCFYAVFTVLITVSAHSLLLAALFFDYLWQFYGPSSTEFTKVYIIISPPLIINYTLCSSWLWIALYLLSVLEQSSRKLVFI